MKKGYRGRETKRALPLREREAWNQEPEPRKAKRIVGVLLFPLFPLFCETKRTFPLGEREREEGGGLFSAKKFLLSFVKKNNHQ